MSMTGFNRKPASDQIVEAKQNNQYVQVCVTAGADIVQAVKWCDDAMQASIKGHHPLEVSDGFKALRTEGIRKWIPARGTKTVYSSAATRGKSRRPVSLSRQGLVI